jgi:hypothetical protein
MTVKKIPISKSSRIIRQQALAVVQTLMDAIVELVTNSDDSYTRLEKKNIEYSGKIEIYITREKGGKCTEFKIRDYAEGMSRDKIEKAIEYGGTTSEFTEGQSVRGLLGRGLKESIIALGEGFIYSYSVKVNSVKENNINCAKIWWDDKKNEALYEMLEPEAFETNDEQINEFINSKKNGTLIKILIRNDKIKVPGFGIFAKQLANHYALRDINSSSNRKIILIFEDHGRNKIINEQIIKFIPPGGQLRCDKKISFKKNKGFLQIKIWENKTPLTNQPVRNDPFSLAGILIKTKGAVLDNQLFKYDGDPAAYYFFGEIYSEDIAKRIRELSAKGAESRIIDLARKGLNWRSDDYCKEIMEIIEENLKPLVLEKKKELDKAISKELPKKTQKILENICDLLNKLAKEESLEIKTNLPTEDIQKLTIIPAYTNIQIGKPRNFSIYAPSELIRENGAIVETNSDNENIKIKLNNSRKLGLSGELKLNQHPSNSNVWYNFFEVIGKEVDEEASILCKLGKERAMSVVRVVPEIDDGGTIKPETKKKGGLFSDILPSFDTNPYIPRVQYDKNSGIINIFVNFPSVKRYLGPDLSEIEFRDDSKAILAELVGEAFCKELARQKIETSGISMQNEGQIDAFNTEVNNMQRKYLDKIHENIMFLKRRSNNT